ncbi:MAG: hypothetical protein HQK99_02245 [Nitrospirae bacterium]|nr:hypothetical protein [Nitrospirota bacterium]
MKNSGANRVVLLIAILAAVVIVVIGTSGFLLYQTAVKMQLNRLQAAAELHARMIEVNIENELCKTERRDLRSL